MMNLEQYYLELSKRFSATERKLGALQRELSDINGKMERNKFIIISIIGYLTNHQSMDMEEFDAIVDYVDKLDGDVLNGKTNASLDYGNFRKEINEALAKLDPRIAKMKFMGKNQLARESELAVDKSGEPKQAKRLKIPNESEAE